MSEALVHLQSSAPGIVEATQKLGPTAFEQLLGDEEKTAAQAAAKKAKKQRQKAKKLQLLQQEQQQANNQEEESARICAFSAQPS